MNPVMRTLFVVLLGGMVCLGRTTLAAEADALARLEAMLPAAAQFEYGKDSAALAAIEQIVVESAKNPGLRLEVEARLARALEGEATRDAKEFFCRQLFTIGTAQSVHQLENLLSDPDLSHMARFALGRQQEPAARAALVRALGKTSGKIQAGILNTLGAMRSVEAAAEVARLLASPDPVVAEAAMLALGNIGTPEAVAALQSARGASSGPQRQKLNAALLLGADRLLESGKLEPAAKIYESFTIPGEALYIKIAGLRGLAAAREEKALPKLVEAIRSGEPEVGASATRFASGIPGREATRSLGGLLSALPAPRQELLLKALGARGDTEAARFALMALRSENTNVRIAAYEALGALADEPFVETILKGCATTKGPEQQAARAALVRMPSGSVTTALVRALAFGEEALRIEAIRALAGRHATSAVDDLLATARDSQTGVRKEALLALGSLVDNRGLERLAALIATFKNAESINAGEQAMTAAYLRIVDPSRRAVPLLAAFDQATPECKPALLRLMVLSGYQAALETIRKTVTDPNPAISEAAVRALAEWPDALPAEDLLGIVRTSENPTLKVVALRGYVRMAGLSATPAAMYSRALELATRPEDKKAVLGSLGSACPASALPIVEPFLAEEALRAEAAAAMIQIADRIKETNAPIAAAALRKVQSVIPDDSVRKRAQEILNQVTPLEGHILEWLIAGAFQEKNKDAHELMNVAFPPEDPKAEVKWEKLTKGVGKWDIVISDTLGPLDDAVAYLRTRISCPAAQEARLEIGSDDGVKVWLNGTVVHTNDTERGLSPRQDIVNVKLNEGWNELLLKVTNRAGGWACSCRVRGHDGGPIDLKYSVE
jgi:HEAT repeat protein